MRIKCPNSDIYLELPGDRTDMKFTCPACHKVHRVTISISTPGEDPPPPPVSSNTKSMTRASAIIPKKYATGAYPPVVDIPIDANFVLLDGSVAQQGQGIDLGQAAAPGATRRPPAGEAGLSSRQTEIVDRRPEEEKGPIITPPPEPAAAPKPEPSPTFASVAQEPAMHEQKAAEPDTVASDAAETQIEFIPGQPREPKSDNDKPAFGAEENSWNIGGPEKEESAAESARPAPEPPAAPFTEPETEEPTMSSRSAGGQTRRPGRGKRKSHAAPVLLLLVLLGAGGYLGWQQYLYSGLRSQAKAALEWSESSWKQGDVEASAARAREAETALSHGRELHTARNLWNKLSGLTGWFGPLDSDTAAEEAGINAGLRREKALQSFVRQLDPSNAAQMAETYRDAASTHPEMAPIFQKAVVNAAVDSLRAETDATPFEQLAVRADAARNVLAPALDEERRLELGRRLDEFGGEQLRSLDAQLKTELAAIASAASSGDASALGKYRTLSGRLQRLRLPGKPEALPQLSTADDRPAVQQLARLSDIVDKAVTSARTALSRTEGDDSGLDELVRRAEDDTHPNAAMAKAAMAMVDETRAQAEDLLRLRVEVYDRLQSEMRRNRNYPGTRLAWAMLRMAFDDPEIAIDPESFRFDSNRARMAFTMGGVPVSMEMTDADFEKRIRANVDGYNFTTGWAFLLHKPLVWMTGLSQSMHEAGVPPDLYPEWEVLEGPGTPLALSVPAVSSTTALSDAVAGAGGRKIFFKDSLVTVAELPVPETAREVVGDFRQTAIRLHDTIMADESISPTLRQALKPVLMGTYQQPDPRDYFDSSFCRRLIEADYLETYIKPMPDAIKRDLDSYREVLGRLEAGFDEFSFAVEEEGTIYAVARLDADFSSDGTSSDQDPETGETVPRFVWRVEKADETVFYSPMPSRFVYAFMMADHYPSRHAARPKGVPALTEVWHATQGLIASYKSGDAKATGDADLWDAAIAEDMSGRYDPTIGPPGWNFPLHVLERDDQGDPVTLATLTGTVKSPDFSGMHDEASRRRAEDAWLDSTAATLSTPGELGLIFHQFFRYCSDSPLPEMPNLIGSHYGLSDTHQTVYESLERRWVGRLIGDCDDLAEFFQVLTSRQGKLSHVMQLPGHAACGYVEKSADGTAYRFIVLQTGPVLQFVAPTLNDVVETAYRSFDRGEGVSHMTTDAVPLLLRFANEETRTPFVLSARIYEDAEYAHTMIQVQAYWHEHVYSAAIKTMEELVAEDQEIGNIKELGSLYERVGFYDKSAEMRYRELEMVKDQPQAAISTLLEIVQLHLQEKDKEKALAALGQMEDRMIEMIKKDDAPEFFRAMTFRSYWAMALSRLGQPARAWKLVKYDATMTKRQLGRVADPVQRVLVVLYDRMCMQRDAVGEAGLSSDEKKAMTEVRRELDEAFGRGYFKSDDSYNTIIGRYFVLGRYAVSDVGRAKGIARIQKDGPYATEPKDQTRRTRGLSEEDWTWFRITPQLYLAMAMEMLDQEEFPELYSPDSAKPLLEDVARAVNKGTGLGSDVAGGDDLIKADLALSFLNRDLEAFRRAMTVVKEKDYSSLYDDAALTFGLHCELIPLAEFPAWIEVFREFFPGSQHYFKVVYRAIDKENYDHALLMAEATARFFPDKELLRKEAEFVRSIIPGLKQRKQMRQAANQAVKDGNGAAVRLQPAA